MICTKILSMNTLIKNDKKIMIMMILMIIIMVMVMIIMEVMIMKIRFLTGT